MKNNEPLDAAMDNLLARRLGEIATQVGGPRKDVGDIIDRGLILLRLLNENGFDVAVRATPSPEPPRQDELELARAIWEYSQHDDDLRKIANMLKRATPSPESKVEPSDETDLDFVNGSPRPSSHSELSRVHCAICGRSDNCHRPTGDSSDGSHAFVSFWDAGRHSEPELVKLREAIGYIRGLLNENRPNGEMVLKIRGYVTGVEIALSAALASTPQNELVCWPWCYKCHADPCVCGEAK